MEDNSLLQLIKISKSFLGNRVLKDVDFSLSRSEIHALVGQNGAGKSTMMRLISGAIRPDCGEIIFEGKPLEKLTPLIAQEAGIGIVHQEFALCLDMTVAENIFLGKELENKTGFISDKNIIKQTAELLNGLHIDINPNEFVRNLSVADQQLVEIAKGIQSKPKVLILDEPTAALTLEEVKNLFTFLKQLKENNVAIVYITHRLQEIMDIADRVTVLRDGEIIGTKNIKDTSIKEIVSLMVGRESSKEFPERNPYHPGAEILNVSGLNMGASLFNINMNVKKGEIVGIAGLVGCGQRELVSAIFGLSKFDSGKILFQGKPFVPTPERSVRKGIGFISESRKKDGLILSHGIRKNASMANIGAFVKSFLINEKKEKQIIGNIVDNIKLKYTSLDTEVQYLSGGNQQKVVLAKWLCSKSKLMIFNEPTRGIDVGAKFDIYKLIHSLSAGGVGIIIVSSDFKELLGLCDRMYVIRDGYITREVENKDISEELLMVYAASGTNC